jgi:chaperonin GroES
MSKDITLEPLADRIIVEQKDTEMKSTSGLIIPDSGNKEKPHQGKVVAVGPGRIGDDGKVIPLSVRVGDNIIFSKYTPDEVEIDSVKYLIMREDSVLAIVK